MMTARNVFRHAGKTGYWMAFEEPLGALGNALEALGARWIAPRAGDGGIYRAAGQVNTPISPAYMNLYASLGMAVYPWVYLSPKSAAKDLSYLRRLTEMGAAGIILDVETEWMNEPAAAKALAAKARAAVGSGVFLAYSSFDMPLYQGTFPWEAFSALDAAFPQLYAYEHNDSGHAKWIAEYDRQWKAEDAKSPAVAACPRFAVGACYRPRTRAGHVLPAMDPAKLAQDIASAAAFMTGGWYSVEALLTGPKEVYEALIPQGGYCAPVSSST